MYKRDKLGRIVEKTETVQGIMHKYAYTYDMAGRLTEVRIDDVLTSTYSYDANGNRLLKVSNAGTDSGKYDAQDRLLSYGSDSYVYGRNGEVQRKYSGISFTDYNYNVFGNLLLVSLANGTKIEYIVDGQNRRIGKKVGGVLMQGLLYQNQINPVAELDGNNQVVSRFVYGSKSNVPDQIFKGDSLTYRVISDHVGSVRLVVNAATGVVAQRMEYDEFGNVIYDSHPGFQPFGFAGGLYEPMTKLVRFGARDYEAGSGRWLSKDPIGFSGGINHYVYCGNDPVNRIDPTGLYELDPVEMSQSIKQVGPLDAASSALDASKAEKIANGSGLPGPKNGPRDAFRHCVWSCLMTKSIGENQSKEVGDIHEGRSSAKDKCSGASEMDKNNNEKGRELGKTNGNCTDQCMEAISSGALQTNLPIAPSL